MRLYRLCTLITVLLLSHAAKADVTGPDHYLMSPNATSLGEYGAIPVSLFTGIPDVNVPVTEMSAGSHTIPISLSYHGGGVRPDQHPGWVGLGWTLNAGGCVSRIVNGIPDETLYHNINMGIQFPNINEQSKFIYKMGYLYNKQPPPELNGEIFNYVREEEPDHFMFNFLDFTGSFYYDHEHGWRVLSDRDVKVIFDIDDDTNYSYGLFDGGYSVRTSSFFHTRSRVINNFKIIDEYGNEYYFGGRCNGHCECGGNGSIEYDCDSGCLEKCTGPCNSVEYSVGFFSQTSEQPTSTAWMLTKIKYADGVEIDYNYQKKEFIAQLGVSETLYKYKSGISGTPTKTEYTYYNGDKSGNIHTQQGYVSGSLISPSYLRYIKSNNWRIEFDIERSKELPYYLDRLCNMRYIKSPPLEQRDEYTYFNNFTPYGKRKVGAPTVFKEDRFYKLTSIKIYDAQDNMTRSYTLEYNDNNEIHKNPRLALMSFREDQTSKIYRFEYEGLERLPLYCTYNIDHWGFYSPTSITSHNPNFKYEDGPTIIRHSDLTNQNYEQYRNPKYMSALLGTMTKIHYPTGGYSKFIYEPNTYMSIVNDLHTDVSPCANTIGGGIRISRIINSHSGNEADEFIHREYFYDNILTSSTGNSTSGILLRPWKYHTVLKEINNNIEGYDVKTDCTIHSSGHVNSFEPHNESIVVGYTWVTEKYPDGSFSIYNFSNFDNGYTDKKGSFQGISNLSVTKPYSSYAITRGKILTKTDYDNNKKATNKYLYKYIFLPDSINAWKHEVYWMPFKCQGIYASSIVEFDMRFFVSYNYHIPTYVMRPDSVVSTEYHDGKPALTETLITKYHSGSLPKSETRILASGEKTLTEYEYLNDYDDFDDGNDLAVAHKTGLLKSVTNYMFDTYGSRHTGNFVRYGYKDRSPVYPDTIITGCSDLNITEKTVRRFDSKYNVVETEAEGSPPVVYVWGYGGAYPVAKIINAHVSDVEAVIGNIENFALSRQPDFSKLQTLRRSLPQAEVYTYRFIPLVGISEITDPGGKVTHFGYDAAGRLSTVTDADGNITDVYDYNYAR